jgi:hypothetical protein
LLSDGAHIFLSLDLRTYFHRVSIMLRHTIPLQSRLYILDLCIPCTYISFTLYTLYTLHNAQYTYTIPTQYLLHIIFRDRYLLLSVPFEQALIFLSLDGFFDAGMLQQALRASKEGLDGETPNDKIAQSRHIGRRLTLAEY